MCPKMPIHGSRGLILRVAKLFERFFKVLFVGVRFHVVGGAVIGVDIVNVKRCFFPSLEFPDPLSWKNSLLEQLSTQEWKIRKAWAGDYLIAVPAHQARWGITDQTVPNVWLAATSVAFAKKIGAKIILHTDNEGKEILGWLPYDEIHLTLENSLFHPTFWASGKIMAQEAEPLGSIHIDLDVFVKRSWTIDTKYFAQCDLIVQSVEENRRIYIENLKIVGRLLKTGQDSFRNLYEDLDVKRNSAFNCGLIGFNTAPLKKRYIEGYYDMHSAIVSNPSYPFYLNMLVASERLCLDLVLEQYWLRSVAILENATVYVLLPEENEQQEPERIHYTHVIGEDKYHPDIQSRIREMLAQLDTHLYGRCLEVTNHYLRNSS